MSTQAVRTADSRLVRWCPEVKVWQPADEPVCNWEHSDHAVTMDGHRLRLRRMLVCATCEQAYFKQDDFKAHDCFSAY